jgi:aryl-alcohol dehydrogenase-like predicted oxidoreductase
MKLALGTASWGQPYGIAQKRAAEIPRILQTARECGIYLIDTAPAYQCTFDAYDFDIVTKTPWDGGQYYAVLIHEDSIKPMMTLLKAKQDGIIEKAGVSVYTPEQLERALKYPIDIVQIPLSIVDGRFLPYLPMLRERGIEIHARSVFLQGVLLMDDPPFLKEQVKQIRKRGNPVDVCLGYVMAQDVDAVVVGVNSAEELRRLAQVKPFQTERIEGEEIDPRKWGR